MIYFIALIVAVLVYVVVKFLLSKVASLRDIAEIIAVCLGLLTALAVVGYIKI